MTETRITTIFPPALLLQIQQKTVGQCPTFWGIFMFWAENAARKYPVAIPN